MSAVLEHPQRHAITAEEFLRMGDAGVFGPEPRLELIEGEIIEMPPIGSPHAGTVTILTRLLIQAAGDAVVWAQNPLILGVRSVPQPDVALVRPRADSYTRSHPAAADVLLVIEVADTTLAYDVGTKVPLYAKAGIAEAWIVDLRERNLRVFRDPSATGYRTSFTLSGDGKAASALLPQVTIAVSALFPA